MYSENFAYNSQICTLPKMVLNLATKEIYKNLENTILQWLDFVIFNFRFMVQICYKRKLFIPQVNLEIFWSKCVANEVQEKH